MSGSCPQIVTETEHETMWESCGFVDAHGGSCAATCGIGDTISSVTWTAEDGITSATGWYAPTDRWTVVLPGSTSSSLRALLSDLD